MEEQSTATREITQNLAQAVAGIRLVSADIGLVAQSAQGVTRDIAQLQVTGDDLKSKAAELKGSSRNLDGSIATVLGQLGHFRIE